MAVPSQELLEFIKSKNRFVVSCHVHPDGDAIGSTLAMGAILSKMGKRVEMICTEGVPTVYHFLDGSSLIKKELKSDYPPEVLVCVDCAEKERIAVPPQIWGIPGLKIINIDHHVTNLGFGAFNLIDAHAAATGEVIYQLIKEGSLPLNRSIATYLYVAIATDTGFFRYTNTTANTLELAALLAKKYQIELGKIAEQVHEQKSFNSIRLLGEVLNTLQVGLGGKVAWAILDQQRLNKFPVENEETESYVNYARSIEGVEVGILFKELQPNEIKLSWRSTSAVDVSKLAAHFGGGGHARAAGCNLNGPLERVVNEVLDYVAGYYGFHVARNSNS
ncbi:MAG: DHH family phosphoesterase [Bacillota bacterium]